MTQANRILEALKEHGPMTSAEIASATDLPDRHVSAHMSAHRKHGTVTVRRVLHRDDTRGRPAVVGYFA